MIFTYGSLYTGIGGIDLGLDRAGMQCRWQVEIDEYAQKVLAKHWPNVARFRDMRECGASNLSSVDLIAGGFPCQPHSYAGKRKGASDERDLWGEFARIICELRPGWVLAENVPGSLSSDNGRFFGGVLRDLAALGYDAEWSVLSACSMGAPHTRERVFVVAYAHSIGRQRRRFANSGIRANIASNQITRQNPIFGAWPSESGICRVAHGIPARVDRLRCLGNAVVPQVAEYIGRIILEHAGYNEQRKAA